MQVVAITGGSGFVGLRLAASLLDDAALGVREVRLMDVRAPASDSIPFAPSQRHRARKHLVGSERLRFVHCDLRDAEQVRAALEGVDTVYHLASYGMSGAEQLNVSMIHAVNVGGTRTLLAACTALRIPRLVYVSTYNTVFTRHVLEAAREDDTPYAALGDFHDEYSKTKMIAEKMVLEANGTTLGETNGNSDSNSSSNGKKTKGGAASPSRLVTCAIRPAAIYGDGEERHFPRILSSVRAGLGYVGIGDPTTQCDWVYVDNLCHGLVLAGASLALSESGSSSGSSASPAAGQAYAISDGQPMNNFTFLRLICAGLGYTSSFRWFLPFWLAFHLAWLMELLRLALLHVCPALTFQPPLTRAEVCKVGVSHYFTLDKAQRDLGYRPLVDVRTAVQRCVEYYMPEYGTDAAKKEFYREQRKKRTATKEVGDSD